MVKIITDTASDITPLQAEQMGVELVSLPVMFGDEPYDQFSDDSFELFYSRLEASKELPVTSQPSPAAYQALFSKAKLAKDDVIVVALSSGLSGTLQSATIAKEMADYDRIFIVDSKQAILGQRLLVEIAVRMRDEGKPATAIAAALEEARGRIVLYGALDTLKYLRMGGRIPRTTEMIGTVMGIKPIITINKEGAIAVVGKARGHAGAVTNMFKLVTQNANFAPDVPVYFGYSGNDQQCKVFHTLCKQKLGLKNTVVYPVGPVVGTHIGSGGFAITYLTKGED